jgi:hypothetical protein
MRFVSKRRSSNAPDSWVPIEEGSLFAPLRSKTASARMRDVLLLLLLAASSAMLLWAQLSPSGAIRFDMDAVFVHAHGQTEPFSIVRAIRELWKSGAQVLAGFLFAYSCIWPHAKLWILAAALWLTRREGADRFARQVAALGKWSFLDVYAMMLVCLCFHFDPVRACMFIVCADVGAVQFVMLPGMIKFTAALVASQVAAHAAATAVRRRVQRTLAPKRKRAAGGKAKGVRGGRSAWDAADGGHRAAVRAGLVFSLGLLAAVHRLPLFATQLVTAEPSLVKVDPIAGASLAGAWAEMWTRPPVAALPEARDASDVHEAGADEASAGEGAAWEDLWPSHGAAPGRAMVAFGAVAVSLAPAAWIACLLAAGLCPAPRTPSAAALKAGAATARGDAADAPGREAWLQAADGLAGWAHIDVFALALVLVTFQAKHVSGRFTVGDALRDAGAGGLEAALVTSQLDMSAPLVSMDLLLREGIVPLLLLATVGMAGAARARSMLEPVGDRRGDDSDRLVGGAAETERLLGDRDVLRERVINAV